MTSMVLGKKHSKTRCLTVPNEIRSQEYGAIIFEWPENPQQPKHPKNGETKHNSLQGSLVGDLKGRTTGARYLVVA